MKFFFLEFGNISYTRSFRGLGMDRQNLDVCIAMRRCCLFIRPNRVDLTMPMPLLIMPAINPIDKTKETPYTHTRTA